MLSYMMLSVAPLLGALAILSSLEALQIRGQKEARNADWPKYPVHERLQEYLDLSVNANELVEAEHVFEVCSATGCLDEALVDHSDGFASLAHALRRAELSGKKKLIVGLVGDSVGAGCCDGRGGFGEGVRAYLQNFYDTTTDGHVVELRNVAIGGQGPMYFSFCSALKGDEDVVIFEIVRPYEEKYVKAFVGSRLGQEYAPAIILLWSATTL